MWPYSSISRAVVVSLIAEFCINGSAVAQDYSSTVSAVDLAQVNRIGNLDWDYTLGTDWDEGFDIGGIIGKKDATITPAIPTPFGTIPAITGDTRSGARIFGNVTGDVGLNFFATFIASGFEAGSLFDFTTEITDIPSVGAGDFFALETQLKVNDNANFVEHMVDLPNFHAGIDFFFHLDVEAQVEYGLFPIVPYGTASFQLPSVAFDQRPSDNDESLAIFAFDLDPDSNNGNGTPPSFAIFEGLEFEERLEFLNNDESIAEKMLSVMVKDKEKPGIKKRLDIGSVQLVNPFGTGESVLGGDERNLVIETSTTDSTVNYSFETPLLRLGLDLDGIAAFLATGESFTRIDGLEIGDKDEFSAKLTADLIDIKYGPEFGFRETVEVRPELKVTLSFDSEVALREGNAFEVTDTYTGMWSDLPEIALLGDTPVGVTVTFEQFTGQQTKRSVLYLTDYLELTVLELEELLIEDAVPLSAPPLARERFSILGDLLGQVELELTQATQTIPGFDINAPGGSFTIMPIPSVRVYWNSAQDDEPQLTQRWRMMDGHAEPDTLVGKTLTIGRGDTSVMHVGELDPMTIVDTGTPDISLQQYYQESRNTTAIITSPANADQIFYSDTTKVIDADVLDIIAESEYEQSGLRRWHVSSIRNDGLYRSTGTTEFDRTDGLLQISGAGEMAFEDRVHIATPLLFHGPGHTLRFDSATGFRLNSFQQDIMVVSDLLGFDLIKPPATIEVTNTPLEVTEQLENFGTIIFHDTNAVLELGTKFNQAASGGLHVEDGSNLTITVPEMMQNGLIEVAGQGSSLVINGNPTTANPITDLLAITSTSGMARIVADDGALVHFTGQVVLENFDSPPAKLSFDVNNNSTLQFDTMWRARFGGVAEINVDETSTFVLSGLQLENSNSEVVLNNQGVVEVFGHNRLYVQEVILVGGVPETRLIGINIVNDGTIRIHPNSSFGFEAELVNYVPGGATLGPGTWELIGETPATPYQNNGAIADSQTAELEILIDRISNDEAYLGRIDFGDTDGDGLDDGYSAEDYDTFLAVSEANVLLSGKAKFDYFNTVRENRGTLTLQNNNHFSTDGGLVNRGTILVESTARLNVFGDLVVDEGSVFVDANSVLSVGANAIEVIGGNVTVERGAVPLNVNTPWIVREKWTGVDGEGNDIVIPANVSYGSAWFNRIGPGGNITLDGSEAVMEPLQGLTQIEGVLRLTGGNQLNLPQSLNNSGNIVLESAGNLILDGDLTNDGIVRVADNSYLNVTGVLDSAGTVAVGGVVRTDTLLLTDDGSLTIDIDGYFGNGESGFVTVDNQATVAGVLDIDLIDGFAIHPGQQFTLLAAGDLIDDGLELSAGAAEFFEMTIGLGSSGTVVVEFLGGEFGIPGDFNGDQIVNAADYPVWRDSVGSTGTHAADANGDEVVDAEDYKVWRAYFSATSAIATSAFGATVESIESGPQIPEPATATLLLMLVAWTLGSTKRGNLRLPPTSRE